MNSNKCCKLKNYNNYNMFETVTKRLWTRKWLDRRENRGASNMPLTELASADVIIH